MSFSICQRIDAGKEVRSEREPSAKRDENGLAKIDAGLFVRKVLVIGPEVLILRVGKETPRIVNRIGQGGSSIAADEEFILRIPGRPEGGFTARGYNRFLKLKIALNGGERHTGAE